MKPAKPRWLTGPHAVVLAVTIGMFAVSEITAKGGVRATF